MTNPPKVPSYSKHIPLHVLLVPWLVVAPILWMMLVFAFRYITDSPSAGFLESLLLGAAAGIAVFPVARWVGGAMQSLWFVNLLTKQLMMAMLADLEWGEKLHQALNKYGPEQMKHITVDEIVQICKDVSGEVPPEEEE